MDLKIFISNIFISLAYIAFLKLFIFKKQYVSCGDGIYIMPIFLHLYILLRISFVYSKE